MQFSLENNPNDMLSRIFNAQAEHMMDYMKIEADNGQLQTSLIPVDVDERYSQARLKDFAWRISEEVGESLEVAHPNTIEEYQEELADVLHFMAEISILLGLDYTQIVPYKDGVEDEDQLKLLFTVARVNYRRYDSLTKRETLQLYTGQFLENLAIAINTLKLKPWSQKTKRPTDRDRLYHYFRLAWISFIHIAITSGIGAKELHQLYFRKSEINQQRRETGY